MNIVSIRSDTGTESVSNTSAIFRSSNIDFEKKMNEQMAKGEPQTTSPPRVPESSRIEADPLTLKTVQIENKG